ncbi:FG-GAP-like repeat-containing protein [Hymenobacter crusticola]|uniref:FG-GAP-like repeat-containing protein n=1 Tax=Hymenobacter crusticola TaxID=1770526 RepID=UPI0015C4FA54|nr:FG-GAP-like repeat-containing protein [Hymenobacter crusticola]
MLVFLGQAGSVSAQVFSVTGTTPPSNRVSVPRTTNVVATFNEPLNTTPATLQSLRVYSFLAGGKKAGTATVSGNTLTFAPGTPFQPGETVQAVVSSAAQSSSTGNTLGQAESFAFQFTTATTPSAGTFGGGSDPTVQSIPSDVALGDLDLVTLNYNGNVVSVRLNDGTGTYGEGSDETITTPQGSGLIRLGDVDNDGDLDFVTANSNTTTASVRLNDGTGTFSGSTEVQVAFNPESVALGDLDRDGDLDVVVANPALNAANVRLNSGSGSFSGSQQVVVGSSPHQVVLHDVDGDGDLDLATANTGNASASIRFNDGSGTFGGSQEVSVGASPVSLSLSDLDGNGTLDLAAANYGANTTSVRLSSTAATAQAAKVLAATSSRLNQQLSVYPNPAHARVQLQLSPELANQALQVSLLNSLGQVVSEQKLAPQAAELVLPQLPTGVYSLQVRTNQGLISKRLMIE